MRKIVCVIIPMLLFSPAMYAQQMAKVGMVGAQFLKIPVGARGIAMGDAFNVIVDDATAVFWNPAGLNQIKNGSLFFSHTRWLADIKMEAGALAKTFPGFGTVALSFSYLSSGDIEETTVFEQEGTGRFFSTSNLMLGLSYARWLTDK
ncbi:MAG: PorV/PorQ family protein, partial [candidate division KSB1 bacterium]|nr:PorV/PorQ family protein [candidate division KSB1 bacterium]